ncbi:thiol-disulfide oxidoreductase LTO1-like [Andrographis paniculata]|uniref:thiol-disulfide oxidoreductase LTO1-like n=1 Tax=Andrographis paniculata TaxID=175694 RepID=UPI0021E868F1|nr:thiol-disulfide oxidoreductase LTO1-like [Andrographis paniculata]
MLTAAASCSAISSPSIYFRRASNLSSATATVAASHSLCAVSLPQFKGNVLIRVSCVSERSEQADQTEAETVSSPSSSETPSSSATVDGDDDSGVSVYKWLVGLGGIGFLETGYLTYLKLADTDAFCPTGGGSCTSILTSDYSNVFGIPLPLIGMLVYGLVTAVGFQLGGTERTFETQKTSGEIILLGVTSSMAVASAYFLYILNTEFVGELCIYCLTSAILSFSLFFITLKRFRLQELQSVLGLQLFIACLVVVSLTASYNVAQPGPSRLADIEIPYFETEVQTKSSPLAISLANHLRSIGAKLYGAFWCTHCHEQKEIFGREAAKLLDYIECFPDGASKETKVAKACQDAKIEGFPTWIINGQVLNGEQQLSELAAISGFQPEKLTESR